MNKLTPEAARPIPMILWCPKCCARHIDEGEYTTLEHATHACQTCGMVWRPAVEPTVGVQFLPGFKNSDGIVHIEEDDGRYKVPGYYFRRGSGDWTKCPNAQPTLVKPGAKDEKPVDIAKARKAHQRLVDVAFGNRDRATNEPVRPHFEIPAHPDDDDIIVASALDELEALRISTMPGRDPATPPEKNPHFRPLLRELRPRRAASDAHVDSYKHGRQAERAAQEPLLFGAGIGVNEPELGPVGMRIELDVPAGEHLFQAQWDGVELRGRVDAGPWQSIVAPTKLAATSEGTYECPLPPEGWWCSRGKHDGPCAARERCKKCLKRPGVDCRCGEHPEPLPQRVLDGLAVSRFYDETAIPLGPQPRFTAEEERAIKDALRKALAYGREHP